MRSQETTSLLQRLKQTNFASVDGFFNRRLLRRDTSEIIVYLSVIAYTVVFSYFTILKYNAFSAYAWDLGIFNQSMWTTLHAGKLFFSTVEQFIIPSGVFFGTHFSPILFLVLPFYAITSSPQALLVFQSFVLALGAVPLYFFAKNSLNNKVIAVAFSITYLFYPPLQGANWFDFHTQAFLPLFFFCAMYFLADEKWPSYFLFVFLALTVAENVPITVVFIGLYGFWRFRTRIINVLKTRKLADFACFVPILTIVMAVAWLFFAGWIRQVNWPFNPAYLQLYKAVDHWSVLGITDDPNRLPLYVIMRPDKALAALVTDWPLKVLYLFLLFGPLLFLSFGSSITAISLAWLVPAFLSNYTPYYTIGDHFPTYPVAFIFLGAVEGFRRISLSAGRSSSQSGRLRALRLSLSKLVTKTKTLLVVSLVFTLTISPLSPVITAVGSNFPQFADYHLPMVTSEERAHAALLQTISDNVLSNASVLTQNSIFVHFSSRANAYVYPLPWMITCNVTVTVLRNGTAQPGASVQFGLLSQTTNASGSAMFEGLPEGNYSLLASYNSDKEPYSSYVWVRHNIKIIVDLENGTMTLQDEGTELQTRFQSYVDGLFQKSQYVMFDATTDSYTANLILLRIQNQTIGDYGLVAFGGNVNDVAEFRNDVAKSGVWSAVDQFVGEGRGIYLFEKNYAGVIITFY